ncbi:MAG TPA: hypothetical protein VLM18_11690 [Croceibacterium sp.]|nr:hypothetical protein [Croceibacterium sp.]
MAHEWIAAATALRYLSDDVFTCNQQRAICERAHSGLIAAKADVLVWNGEEHRERPIPKEFWWAEGHDALEQNWNTGDFSTWIDQKIEVKAFGVSFDFVGLSDLAPAERRAVGMQRISVAGDEDWMPAKELHRLIYERNAISKAGPIILEASAMGQLAARAIRATGVATSAGGNGSMEWAAREWDVPLWFWRDYTKIDSSMQDWALGKVRGQGFRNRVSETIELQGLYFHRAGLQALGLAAANTAAHQSGQSSNRGRRSKYDWPGAMLAIFGQIHRGDFKPENQADIEKALIAHLTDDESEPSPSTVRPFAKQIWEESIRE